MRYLVQSKIFSESYLRNLAKSLFAGIRQDPIAPYCLEHGGNLQYVWFGFDVTTSTWADKSNPNVQIEQVDFHTLNLILPRYMRQYSRFCAPRSVSTRSCAPGA
jgi:hypothetical protein